MSKINTEFLELYLRTHNLACYQRLADSSTLLESSARTGTNLAFDLLRKTFCIPSYNRFESLLRYLRCLWKVASPLCLGVEVTQQVSKCH